MISASQRENIAKLALGTAQFGLDYGINNKRGKVPKLEAFRILDYATNCGIKVIDTAPSYGESEEVIGDYIKTKSKNNLKIVSKFPNLNDTNVAEFFERTAERLNAKCSYGYLIHDFKTFIDNPNIWLELEKLKDEGKVQKVGFSLYHPAELDLILRKKIRFDLIQVPFSIFDQRFAEYFERLKKKNVEVHVRSVFLQGLLFKKTTELEEKFSKIRPKIKKLNKIASENCLSIPAICINFALLNNIDKIVIGVDSIKNLKENIKELRNKDKVKIIYNELADLK